MTKKSNPEWHEQKAAECRARAKQHTLDAMDCSLSKGLRAMWRQLAKIHDHEAELLRQQQRSNEQKELSQ